MYDIILYNMISYYIAQYASYCNILYYIIIILYYIILKGPLEAPTGPIGPLAHVCTSRYAGRRRCPGAAAPSREPSSPPSR